MKWSMMAALGFTAVLTSCSSPQPQQHKQYDKLNQEVNRIVDEVRMASGTELYSLLSRLIAYDVFAVDPVIELAKDESPRLRSNAMYVLAHIKDEQFPSSQEKIRGALHDGIEDKNKLVRLEAAAGLVARNDWSVIPVLVEGLEDPRPRVRYNCHQTLMAVTSEDFGYLTDAPEEERQQAISRWKAWYAHWESEQG